MIVTLPPRRRGEPDAELDLQTLPEAQARHVAVLANDWSNPNPRQLVEAETVVGLTLRLWLLTHRLDTVNIERLSFEVAEMSAWMSHQVAKIDALAAAKADAIWESSIAAYERSAA